MKKDNYGVLGVGMLLCKGSENLFKQIRPPTYILYYHRLLCRYEPTQKFMINYSVQSTRCHQQQKTLKLPKNSPPPKKKKKLGNDASPVPSLQFGCFQKYVFFPQIIHLFIGFFIINTHPFWWVFPLFLVQHPYG